MDLFSSKGGYRVGKVISDALEKVTLRSGTVNSLTTPANHGLTLVPADTGEETYRRVGWLCFVKDDHFGDCELEVVKIVGVSMAVFWHS